MALSKKDYNEWKGLLQILSYGQTSVRDMALIDGYYRRASESQIEKLPKYMKRALGLEEAYEGELYGKWSRFRKWEKD